MYFKEKNINQITFSNSIRDCTSNVNAPNSCRHKKLLLLNLHDIGSLKFFDFFRLIEVRIFERDK